ncbi:hypothetical protein Rcae01_01231 [Novipirellula caenicola]|uniref:Uncharacterized protein n=1 Tax=Novipirellula caenicola TaxID=1536901 RepID=A0ABP9VKQ8_9BACT
MRACGSDCQKWHSKPLVSHRKATSVPIGKTIRQRSTQPTASRFTNCTVTPVPVSSAAAPVPIATLDP